MGISIDENSVAQQSMLQSREEALNIIHQGLQTIKPTIVKVFKYDIMQQIKRILEDPRHLPRADGEPHRIVYCLDARNPNFSPELREVIKKTFPHSLLNQWMNPEGGEKKTIPRDHEVFNRIVHEIGHHTFEALAEGLESYKGDLESGDFYYKVMWCDETYYEHPFLLRIDFSLTPTTE